jgi:hypothetical protein
MHPRRTYPPRGPRSRPSPPARTGVHSPSTPPPRPGPAPLPPRVGPVRRKAALRAHRAGEGHPGPRSDPGTPSSARREMAGSCRRDPHNPQPFARFTDPPFRRDRHRCSRTLEILNLSLKSEVARARVRLRVVRSAGSIRAPLGRSSRAGARLCSSADYSSRQSPPPRCFRLPDAVAGVVAPPAAASRRHPLRVVPHPAQDSCRRPGRDGPPAVRFLHPFATVESADCSWLVDPLRPDQSLLPRQSGGFRWLRQLFLIPPTQLRIPLDAI